MKPAICILAILCPFLSMCQLKPITGQVVNQNNEPIPAATITLLSTNQSTITNNSGEFSLPFPDSRLLTNDSRIISSDSLIVSAIGYETLTISLANYKAQTIILIRKTTALSEITIYTGYQEFKKERATGSFDKIDNELFNRIVAPDILSRLEGVAQSTLFTKNFASTGIFIRGISTLRTNGTDPLIILDNFPYEGDINNINPNDVENITILRDAAASSIWGAKAGNGVIVITTKKAGYNQKPTLSFNYNITTQQKTDLLADRNFIESGDFIQLERFLFNKGLYESALNNTNTRPVVSPVIELLARQRAGLISATEAETQINAYTEKDIRNDIMNYLRNNQFREQYAINLAAGSNMLNYQFSLGYDNTMAEIKGNKNNRATLTSQINFRPRSNIEIQTGINYTYRKTTSNGIENLSPAGGKSVIFPYAQLVEDDGTHSSLIRDYRMAWLDTTGSGKLLDWKYRPLDEIKLADNTSIEKALLLKLNIRFNFLRRFSFIINAQLAEDNNNSNSYSSIQTYNARNLINRYTQVSGSTVKNIIPVGGILDYSNGRTSGYAFRSQLNYAADWKSKYRLNVITGFETRQSHSRSSDNRAYGYNNDILTYSPVDYTTAYQLYSNFGTAAIPVLQGFDDLLNRFVSVYSNAAFTLNNRYIFSASARKDASNLFGVNTNKKWTPLWSAGAAWDIAAENFYSLKILPSLRIRLTYGFNGNIDNSISSQPIISNRSPVAPTFLRFASLATAWNPDLRWEKVRMINIGIDFSFRKERVSGSVEYYSKNATGLLASAPVDPTLGIPGNIVTMNIANLTGRGLDLKLNTSLIDAGIKVKAMFLFSYSTNKVADYLLESTNKGSRVGYGYSITPIKGKDPYALISYKWAGLDPQTGDPIGIVNDTLSKNYFAITNSTSWNDMVIGGSSRPPFFGSFLPSLTWKQFTISANIGYRFGYYFRRGTISYSSLFNSWLGHTDYYKRWQQPGDELFTTVPSMTYPANTTRDAFYQYSEATIEKADHVRLQDINISWNLSNIKLNTLIINKIQLYSYISNLGIIWRASKSGLDPDYGNSLSPRPAFSIGSRIIF